MKIGNLLLGAMFTIYMAGPRAVLAVEPDVTGPQLAEIVVTAQKRVEDVDKVPISISVFDRSAMDQRSILDMADIAAVTPGVDYQSLGGTTRITIRGITTGANASGYATTGLYIDDVPIQVRPSNLVNLYGASQPKVFDLDRVEVLRGPQGTLFGAGAEGGAIRFITPQPSLTEDSGYTRARAGVTDGGDPSYEAGVAVGHPILQNELGVRLSAWHRRDGGYIQYNSALPGGYQESNGNWQDSDVVRGAVTFAPAKAFQVTASFFYQNVYTNNIDSFEPASSAAYGDYFAKHWSVLNPQYSNVGSGHFVNPSAVQTPGHDRFSLPALKAVWDIGTVELTSDTSFLYRKSAVLDDFTPFAPLFFGVGPTWITDPGAVVGDRNSIETTQNVFSQEVRAQSMDSTRALQWTVGIFYTDARQSAVNTEMSPYAPTYVLAHYGKTITQVFGQPLLPGNISYLASEPTVDKQTAAFGQVSYRISGPLSVIAGVRVAHESNEYSAFQNGPEAGAASSLFGGKQSATVTDPKYGVNYQLSDDNLLYLSAAKGDRIGGVNAPLALNAGACAAALQALGVAGTPTTYEGDSLWSYEIGSKNKFWNGRIRVESSVFHIDWSNVQDAVPVPACANSFVSNLGKATSNGFDLQTSALIAENIEVGFDVGYTNAKVAKSIVIGTKLASVDGSQLNPYASPWILSPRIQYNLGVGADTEAYLRIDDTYHSRNLGPFAADNPNSVAFTGSPVVPNPAYNELNTHVGFTRDKWDVAVFALNLLNSHPLLYYTAGQVIQPTGAAFTIRPLTIGAEAEYRW